MLHWQPATCCIFQLFINICYLANKVLLLLLLLLHSPISFTVAQPTAGVCPMCRFFDWCLQWML